MAKGGGGGFLKFLLGLVLGVLLVPAVVWGWFRFGNPPVAVADAPLPFERQIVNVPMSARIAREAPKVAPFGTSEDAFEGGAKVYREHCAACHGTPGHDVSFAKNMYPRTPQLWLKHKKGNVVGVSDDPVGETYWKVDNGIRLTGMPSFNKTLSDTQRWQVSLLLANADKDLPDPVKKILTQP